MSPIRYFKGSSLLVLTDVFRYILLDSDVEQLLAIVRSRCTITQDEQTSIDAIVSSRSTTTPKGQAAIDAIELSAKLKPKKI